MNNFITLHRVYKNPEEEQLGINLPVRINVSNIVSYYPLMKMAATCVCCLGDYEYYVKETPEEIESVLNPELQSIYISDPRAQEALK